MAVCVPSLWLIMELVLIFDNCRRGMGWLTMVPMGLRMSFPRVLMVVASHLVSEHGQGSGLYLDYHCV